MTSIHAEPALRWPRVVRRLTVGAVLLLSAAPAAVAVGCSDPPEIGPPANPCVGGVMLGGQCHAKCDPDKCAPGNVCVNNECRLVCSAHTDCVLPYQACVRTTEDDLVDGEPLFAWMAGATGVCLDTGILPVAGKRTFGDACPNGVECDGFACPNGLPCDPDACHDGVAPHPELCMRDEAACGDAERCNIGTCEGSGAPCVLRDCAQEECTPMVCAGFDAPGDANAYCSHHDCQQDADCPAGWRCGVVRDPHDICGATCNAGACTDDQSECQVDGDCQKGNNTVCGETEEPCIDPAAFGANGASYFEGALCLLRKTCVKRESCARCETNQDCSTEPDQICVPFGDGNVCGKFCATEGDCLVDEACWPSFATCELDPQLPCPSVGCPPRPCVDGVCATPPGEGPGGSCDTDADCPPQSCIPRSVCLPREGSCRTAGGGFCHHCVDDTDCAGVGTAEVCDIANFGEYACLDYRLEATCPGGSDSECPVAPSGAHGECLNEGEGYSSSDWAYERCLFPYDNSTDQFTCWP